MAVSKSRKSVLLHKMFELFSRSEDWLILINADPDAIASALALKRIMSHRTGKVLIARINEISRPDNLAMIRLLKIPIIPWSNTLKPCFQRFALVDSQPHHNDCFKDIPFSIVVDHHPVMPEFPVQADYVDIRPDYGVTSTIFTDYLRALKLRPGARLATALQYGIRTDTATFTRKCSEMDLRSYQRLAKYADTGLLMRIIRSEYLPEWLPYFSRAFSSLHGCGNKGHYAFLGEVENPDLLVVIADFFMRVHGLRGIAIGGIYNSQVVVIFRGDGSVDLGDFAYERLGSLGSAGGHRAMARAEFPLSAVENKNVEVFLYKILTNPKK